MVTVAKLRHLLCIHFCGTFILFFFEKWGEHEYASDMWVVPSIWLQYREVPVCVGVAPSILVAGMNTDASTQTDFFSPFADTNYVFATFLGSRWLRCRRYINGSCAMFLGGGRPQNTWHRKCILRRLLSRESIYYVILYIITIITIITSSSSSSSSSTGTIIVTIITICNIITKCNIM